MRRGLWYGAEVMEVAGRLVGAYVLALLLAACGPRVGERGSDGESADTGDSPTGTSMSGSGQTGGMDGPDGSGSSGGSITGVDSSGGESAETGESPLPSTCPEDADLQIGDCSAQGDSCEHGDLACSCVCGCEGPEPGKPGIWQCSYAREDAWTLSDATVHIDCGAETIRSSLIATLDNGDGASTVTITMLTPGGYFMTPPGGGEETICGGLCVNGEACPDIGPILVERGDIEVLEVDFVPRNCDRLGGNLCTDFCGGTADFMVYGSIEIDGITVSLGPVELTAIPIVCD